MSYKILLIEPDPGFAEKFQRPLIDAGYDVVVAGDPIQALDALDREQPDLALVDTIGTDADLCATLKGAVQDRHMPVVALFDGSAPGASADHDEQLDRTSDDGVFVEACRVLLAPEAGAAVTAEVAVPVAASASVLEGGEVSDAIDRLESFLFDEGEEGEAEPAFAADFADVTPPPQGTSSIEDSLQELARVQELREAGQRQLGATTVRDLADVPEGQGSPDVGGEDIEERLDDLFSGTTERNNEPEISAASGETGLPVPAGGVAVRSQFTGIDGELASIAETDADVPPLEELGSGEDACEPLATTEDSRRSGFPWWIAAAAVLLVVGAVVIVVSRGGSTSVVDVPVQAPAPTRAEAPSTPPEPVVASGNDCDPGQTCGEAVAAAGFALPTIGVETTSPAPPEAVAELTTQVDSVPDAEPAPSVALEDTTEPAPAVVATVSIPQPPAPRREPRAVRPDRSKLPSGLQPVSEPPSRASVDDVDEVGILLSQVEAPVLPEPPEPPPSDSVLEASAVQRRPPMEEPELAEPGDAREQANPLVHSAETTGFKPPVLLHRTEPRVDKLTDVHRGRTVMLKVLVNETGKIVKVVVDQGTPDFPELEAASIYAVLNWRYEPALEQGVAVKAWATAGFDY